MNAEGPTEKIRIADLSDPVLTRSQCAALRYGEDTSVELSVDAVLKAATDNTQLEDFGPSDFRERLALWLEEIDQDKDRTGLGRLLTFSSCVRYATNRLLIRDLLERHPEIQDQKIRRPIIVVGLPRSGTTHLVNMIAADERLRSLPLWESQEPVPNPLEAHDPRYERCAGTWTAMQAQTPLIAAMHPMHPEHIHEELELQLPDFSSYHPEWVARVPRWRDYYLSHDQTPHYEYLKTMLKILQWIRPRERWILKSPQHLEQLGPLMKTFPDATIVVTHRDPVSVIQSAATMMTYSARMSYRHTRPEWTLDYWSQRVRTLLEASVRDRALLPAGRTTDVLFHEFVADDFATVERIYEVAGLEMNDAARGQIRAYLDRHLRQRKREGQVVYDLRADFGAQPKALREPFSFYMNQFAPREEVE